jgi:hypothetical protein
MMGHNHLQDSPDRGQKIGDPDRSFEATKISVLSPIPGSSLQQKYCFEGGMQVPNGEMLESSNYSARERPAYTEVSLKFSKGIGSASGAGFGASDS